MKYIMIGNGNVGLEAAITLAASNIGVSNVVCIVGEEKSNPFVEEKVLEITNQDYFIEEPKLATIEYSPVYIPKKKKFRRK